MSLQLRIEHADGTTTSLPAEQSAKRVRDLNEQGRAEAVVYRDDWAPLDLDERTAELYLVVDGTDEFGGRLDDAQASGGTVSVRIASFETDAADAEPTGDNLVYQNAADSTIVTDAVNSVPTLSPGTINTVVSGLSYTASFASQSKVIRDQREATGAEVRYNADQTVDYKDRLGADKSASVTLGPAQGNIGEQFRKTLDVREEVTHVRALGAQQGPDQVTTTPVADSYAGGRAVWRRYSNKEVIDQSRLQEIADTRVAMYDGEPRALTIKCTIYDEDLQVGDTVHVDYPEEDVDRDLRITQLEHRWGRGGTTLRATLSTRALPRDQTDAKRFDDLQRFNRGYQGFVDRDQVTSGWNPAGDGTPQTLVVVNWPDDIVEEKTVELTVLGRAWRSPVSAGSHSHSFSIGDHSHSVTLSDHTHDFTYGVPFHVHEVTFLDQQQTSTNDGHSHTYDQGSQTGGPNDNETNSSTSAAGGGTTETTSSGGSTSDTTGSTVPLNPQVTTTFGGSTYYPSDVEVAVDGTVITTIAGDSTGDWTETIDLSGQLSPGQNTITATPTSTRGELNLSLASELFRRGKSN